MDLGLKNRVAIVTGSSQGIGWAIADRFAQEGAKVVICARNLKQLELAAEKIQSTTGSEVCPIQTDLTSSTDITRLVAQTLSTFHRIDVLVNNTGGPPPKYFSETTPLDWAAAFDSLLLSVVNCCSKVIPHMKQHNWGRIINITSFAAKQPVDRLILSNSLRAGILGFTKTLSNELGPEGILVNAICPGWTQTQRLESLARQRARQTSQSPQEVLNDWARQIPLKRLARPEEIAYLAVFLASDCASYITGTVIQVDGGYIQAII
jgi:3-oxoacyl-[acyl-carrier protein] reductase